MANYENRILYGFSNITVTKNGLTYEILGAKSVQVNIQIEKATARNRTQSFVIAQQVTEASGTMQVLGLTAQEQSILFGYKYNSGVLEVGNFTSDEVELSFRREKADGKYITYKMFVVFSPASIDASTIEDSIEESTISLDFEIIQKDGVYYRQYEN